MNARLNSRTTSRLTRAAALLVLAGLLPALSLAAEPEPPRQMEQLDRGVIALHSGKNEAFISWRLLANDPEAIAFNVYRKAGDGEPTRLTTAALTGPTHFIDRGVTFETAVQYLVNPVVDGIEGPPAQSSPLPAGSAPQPFFSIPLKTLSGHSPGDASVGDLDGDGQYEIVLKQEQRPRDNSRRGPTGETKLEAYKLDGTFLWRINFGPNIREGAHYTPFLVYDFDSDGLAEVMCKTADGTVDGVGKVIGDGQADHRNADGYILEGPEFLTVFEGKTGRALATADYIPPRGRVADWGDSYGNRVDRFLACVAHLDGVRPSAVFCRGYYTRAVLAAWDWRDGQLNSRWVFDSDDGTPGNRDYRGQGNHNLSVGDVTGDGRDEIIYGSCVIGSDGRGLYSTGLGHGDAMHLSDLDPDRPGLEVFKANGDKASRAGLQLRDARTGQQIWGIPSTGRDGVVRACSLDIDPRYAGAEMWGKGEGVGGLYNAKGERISDLAPRTCNMGCWWDGDLLRELLNGVTVTKWDRESQSEDRLLAGFDHGVVSNNGSKSNPCLCADILGDWREEIIARTRDGSELRVFSTTIPTEHRFTTLMHDPIYRLGIAWQNVGYNQPAHTGFSLGHGMTLPPARPRVVTIGLKPAPERPSRSPSPPPPPPSPGTSAASGPSASPDDP